MKYNALTTMGELEVLYLEERPSFFSKSEKIAKRVVIMPSDNTDFEAVMLDSCGRTVIAPVESALAASLYFHKRGIPRDALSLTVNRETVTIPRITEIVSGSYKYEIKCKQLFTKCELTASGITNTVYTNLEKHRTRILPLPAGSEATVELIKQLNVSNGAPNTVRSLAYSSDGSGYRVECSDRVITLDTVLPLLAFLSAKGSVGALDVYISDRCYSFDTSRTSDGFMSISIPCSIN